MGPPAPSQPLVGRAAELEVLAGALTRVRADGSAVVLLEGEPGIGKTRLLEQALADAAGRGLQVALGRAAELERNRPFGVLAAALGCTPGAADPRRAAIGMQLADPDPGPLSGAGRSERTITVTSDPGLQFRVVDALRDLVHELAVTTPLVLGIDDLQWVDPSTLLTLAEIVRSPGTPVGLIATLRPTSRTTALDRLLASLEGAGAQRVAVRPLSEAAVRELVTELVSADPGPDLLSEVSSTSGNPLYLTELLGALTEDGALRIVAGRTELIHRALPPTLRLTILRRLSFLSSATLQALRTAAVLGSRFSLTDLATVSGDTALHLADVLAEAFTAGVLGDDGERLRFRHDLVRDAIYAAIPPSVRRDLHREAGHRLAQAGAPALQVAEQLSRGATVGDREAKDWLVRTARDLVAESPASAAALLDRAVAVSMAADPDREQLVLELAAALLWAGQVAEAAELCRGVIAREVGPTQAAARICLGHALLTSGQPRAAYAELARTDAAELPDELRAAVRAWQSVSQIWLADLGGAAASAERALAGTELVGTDLVRAIATTMLGVVCRLRGQLDRAARLSEQAIRAADQSPGRSGHRYPVLAPYAYALLELDRVDDARAAVEKGLRISEELGTAWHLPSYQMVSAVAHFLSGAWDEAVNAVDASLELGATTGEAYGIPVSLSVAAEIALHRNDLPRARELIAEASRRASGTEDRYGAQRALAVQALVLDAEGRTAEAGSTLWRAWEDCARFELVSEYRSWGPDLVRLLLRTDERDRAREVVAAVSALAEANDVDALTATADRCRGLLADDPDLLRSAALVMAPGIRPLELAASSADAGMALVRHGDADRGRPLLEQALTIYQHLQATRDIGRVQAILREAGVRRGPRTVHRRPRTGWDSLTETEQTVAALVAEGLSNPQIGQRLYISGRTVQTHLAHVFGKLDLSSRTELAVQVATHRASNAAPAAARERGGFATPGRG